MARPEWIDNNNSGIFTLVGVGPGDTFKIADSHSQLIVDGLVTVGANVQAGTSGGLTIAGGTLTLTVPLLGADGAVGAPSWSFVNETTTGVYLKGAGDMRLAVGGADQVRFLANQTILTAANKLEWGASGVTSPDLVLFRNGVGILGLGPTNGTVGTVFDIYNNAGGTTERLRIGWQAATNVMTIQTIATTTDTVRAITIQPAVQVVTGTAGADVSVIGGAGLGAASGGTLTLTGGASGVTSGTAGPINLTGGAAGAGSGGNGGNVVLAGGAKDGAGTVGSVQIAPATTALLGFYNATPVVQPAASADAHTVAAGSVNAVFTTTTFDGSTGSSAYTVGGIVKQLKALGLLAA